MQDTFITRIHIDKVRHLENIDIELSETERRHLILTGKNGSGKTSLLEAMRESIRKAQRESATQKFGPIQNSNTKYPGLYNGMILGSGVSLSYFISSVDLIDTVCVYISTRRTPLLVPAAMERIEVQGKTVISHNTSKDFLKYILNLDYQLYGAQADKDNEKAENLKKWFDKFDDALREIYNCDELILKRDTKNLSFTIQMPGREPFALNEMADGYAAFLEIYMELLMRLEGENSIVNYDSPAIVLIDEIETHLHVELQKRVLPFLTKMFPNIQFIVATHSPFVISSVSNAVVYDLEKQIRLEDASLYSYDEIVEGFYDVDSNSIKAEADFERYKALCEIKSPSDVESREIINLRTRLEQVSPANKNLFLAFAAYERNSISYNIAELIDGSYIELTRGDR